MTEKLQAPGHGLSLEFITADAMNVDWGDVDRYDIILPRPTYGDVEDRAPDLLADWEAEAGDLNRTAPLTDEHLEAFGETDDAYYEWRDGFQPIMNFAWPVSFAYGLHSTERVATLIDRFAGACTLIEFNNGESPWDSSGYDHNAPDYAIALTGGGMDLSDHIAVAYLCCGCVPPERILSGLDGFTGPARSGRLIAAADLFRQAFDSAADYFRNRAERLEVTLGRMELGA